VGSKILKVVLIVFAIATLVPVWDQPQYFWVPGIFLGMLLLTLLRIPQFCVPWVGGIGFFLFGTILVVGAAKSWVDGRIPLSRIKVYIYRSDDPGFFFLTLLVCIAVAIVSFVNSADFMKSVLTRRSTERGKQRRAG
jgi:hypothetical protein